MRSNQIESEVGQAFEPELSAMDKPQIPNEGWATYIKLYQGFEHNASLAEMKDLVIKLLGAPLTALIGAVLVLGREVAPNETDILRINSFSKTTEQAFWLLVSKKRIEEDMARMNKIVK